MPSCGGRHRAPGNPLPSTLPEQSRTNPLLACNNTTIDNFVVADNLKLQTKIGDQMEDSILQSMWERSLSSNLTLSITENHTEPNDHKKKTVKNTIDNMKANDNNTVPRAQEPNSKKINTAGIDRKVTFDITKNKMPATKECTNTVRESSRP